MCRSDKPAVTTSQVARQAVGDWFGKEVQNGYTMTYVWMTNQLGHFTLGFLFTFILVWIVEVAHATAAAGCSIWFSPSDACSIASRHLQSSMLLIPGLGLATWIYKEVRDCVVAMRDAKGNPFRFDIWDVVKDALTAVWFISVGIAVAYLSFLSWFIALLVFFSGVVVALIPAKYWLSRKMCFQQADPPFLYRLADFSSALAPPPSVSVKEIEEYAAGRALFRNLLIFGDVGSGRTSLAVGILTEHTFLVRSARYLTWAKFIENAQGPEATVQEGVVVWPWRQSDILVLDDLVKTIGRRPVTAPSEIGADLRGLPSDVVATLADRHNVWVLGPGWQPQMRPENWIEELAKILGISIEAFRYVELVQPPRQKPRVPFAQFSGH